MQAESESQLDPLPTSGDHKPGFMSRRRRLRNRWNVHMRKDQRAQERALRRALLDGGSAATPSRSAES